MVEQSLVPSTRDTVLEHSERPTWANAWLEAYRRLGTIKGACDASGVTRMMVRRLLGKDPHFAEEYEDAKLDHAERLEDFAIKRATQGLQKLVVHQGKPVFVWEDENGNIVPEGHESAAVVRPLYEEIWTPTLLMFLMKGTMPEKYRDTLASPTNGTTINQHVKVYIPPPGSRKSLIEEV